MELTTTEVEHLAKLARLELTPAEVERYTKQLGEVLAYVDKLKEISSVDGTVVTGGGVNLRTDEVASWPAPGELIKQAPDSHDNLISVPAVFDRE